MGNFVLLEEFHESILDDHISELLIERPNVGDKRRGKKHISQNDIDLISKANDRCTPSLTLSSKRIDKSLGKVKFLEAASSLILGVLLCLHNFVEFVLKNLELGAELSNKVLHLLLLCIGNLELLVHLSDGFLFRLHFDEHIIIDGNVLDPHADTSSSNSSLLDVFFIKVLVSKGSSDVIKVDFEVFT